MTETSVAPTAMVSQRGEHRLDAVECAVELKRGVVEEHGRHAHEHLVEAAGVGAHGEHVRVERVEDVVFRDGLREATRFSRFSMAASVRARRALSFLVTYRLHRLGAWPSRP